MNYLKNQNHPESMVSLQEKTGASILLAFFIAFFVLSITTVKSGLCLGWPDIKIRLFPDASFAVVETATGKKLRHCPHHDLNGELDMEQVIFCLGTLEKETWLFPKYLTVAEKHLEKHYNRFAENAMKSEILEPVNINSARLTELVRLPQIGPVLAVKITEYRDTRSSYFVIEDIEKVEGIGRAIFTAIRHYIRTD